jgi:two-component system, NarL family, response regulator DegU
MQKQYLKILIIDDNPTFVHNFSNLIQNVLVNRIENIDTAFSGEEGLTCLINSTYDFAFVDIDMSDISGIEMTKMFNSENYRKPTKIIAISFHNEMEYVAQMISAGASSYLVKDEINFDSISRLFEKK